VEVVDEGRDLILLGHLLHKLDPFQRAHILWKYLHDEHVDFIGRDLLAAVDGAAFLLGDSQLEHASEQAVQEVVELIDVELLGVTEAKDAHDVLEDDVELPLQGDQDHCQQLQRVYSPILKAIQHFEELVEGVSLVTHDDHFFGGVEPELDGDLAFLGHGQDHLLERLLGPP